MKKLFKRKKTSNIPRRRLVDDADARQSGKKTASTSNVFRRNRTLTGTTSNNFDSTVSIRSDMESHRMHVHHLTKKRRKLFGVFIVVLLSALLVWTLLSSLTARVTVSISDQNILKPIDKIIYEKTIQDYLNSNPLSRLSFFLDQSALNVYITQKLPEVRNISQSGMLTFGETEFALQMRDPVAGWRISDKQNYVDSRGVSFEKNYFADPSVQIIDNSGAGLVPGAAIVSNRLLSFVGRVVSTSKGYGVIVSQAILPKGTTRELNLKVKGVKYYIKLSIDRPVGEQVEDMARAISFFKTNGINPDYVDIRVSGKAFYK